MVTGCSILDTGYSILVAGHWKISGVGCKVYGIRVRLRVKLKV
jgi:hypothetical protein